MTPRQQQLAAGTSIRVNIESYGMSPGIVRKIRDEILADAKAVGVSVDITNVDGYFLSVKVKP